MKKTLTLIAMLAALSLSAGAGQMYEWRDPQTGRLMLGDKPPGGVEHWKEGELRPEEKARQAQKSAEERAEHERLEAAARVEEEKKKLEIKAENENKQKEYQALRAKKCTGNTEDSGIRIGMSAETFTFCFGLYPDDINTTKTSTGTREQWVYRIGKKSEYYYFTNGILTAIQK